LLVAGVGFLGFADGHLLASKFDLPQGISFHPNGSLLAVADSGNHVVRIVDLARATVKTLAGSPGKSGSAVGVGSSARFNRPLDVAFDATGDFLYVADTGNDMVKRIQLATANVTVYAGTGNPKWDRSEGPGIIVETNSSTFILHIF
jgi:DNA-binding beta-propeller fold protein YncE